MKGMENHLEQKKVHLDISFSLDDEIERVEWTLKKYQWYESQGYNPTLPAGLNPEETSETEIENRIKEDFNPSVYEQKKKEIQKQWIEMRDDFFEKAKSLNLLIQEEYLLFLTRYGVGGSYSLPNRIIINFSSPNYTKTENVMMIVFHEIIHLSIEELIKKYNISHWTKERLVDMIYNKIFEGEARAQKDPEDVEMVEKTFDLYFPDMERVMVELNSKK